MEKHEVFKKINLQMKKGYRNISSEKAQAIVQDILDANIDSSEFIIESEMPKTIMGVEVDWNSLKVKASKKIEEKKIIKKVEEVEEVEAEEVEVEETEAEETEVEETEVEEVEEKIEEESSIDN